MADLKPSDINQLTAISGQIGQDIADSITFVESQIAQLSNELTNIAPVFFTYPLTDSIAPPDPIPDTISGSGYGITPVGPTKPTGLDGDTLLAEPVAPTEFAPAAQTVDLPEAADFAPVIGAAVTPDVPTLISGTISGSPVFKDVVEPNAPEAPTLAVIDSSQIVIPPVPSLSFPVFDEDLPLFDVTLPSFSFNFTEQPYQSGLLDATTVKLLNDVLNGGTGLGAAIEDAIFDRASERDSRNIDTEITRLKNQASVSGFELPFGVLLEGVSDIVSKHDDKLADLSREIAIEQAQLAQNNTQFAIQQSISVEGTLIAHANNVAERTFQAARSTTEFQIAFHNAEVAFYNVRLERYKQAAQVHFELLRTETVKLDLYRAELEGANTQIQKDRLKIEEFTARVGKLSEEIQLFNAEVGIMNNTNDLNRTRVANFSASIDAFNATISQNRNNVELHNAQLRSSELEFARVQTEIAVHNAQLETIKLNSGNLITDLNAKIDNQKNELTAAQNAINLYSTKTSRVGNRENSVNALYNNEVGKFGAVTESQKAAIALQQDNVRIKQEHAIADMDRVKAVTEMAIQKNFKEWDFRTVVAQSVLAAKQFILEAGARSDDQTIQNI